MKNFYTSYTIGILIGLLLCLVCLLMYVIITEHEEEKNIKLNHAMIIKGLEKQNKNIAIIAKQLQIDIINFE